GDGCTPTCAREICGDGIRHRGEECDDGNDVDTDGCTRECEAHCAPHRLEILRPTGRAPDWRVVDAFGDAVATGEPWRRATLQPGHAHVQIDMLVDLPGGALTFEPLSGDWTGAYWTLRNPAGQVVSGDGAPNTRPYGPAR